METSRGSGDACYSARNSQRKLQARGEMFQETAVGSRVNSDVLLMLCLYHYQ